MVVKQKVALCLKESSMPQGFTSFKGLELLGPLWLGWVSEYCYPQSSCPRKAQLVLPLEAV